MRWIGMSVVIATAFGCGGSAASSSPSYGGRAEGGMVTQGSSAEESYDLHDDLVSGDSVRPDGEMVAPSAAPMPSPPQMYAEQRAVQPTGPGTPSGPQASPTATDATPTGPLLIYEAQLYLAVFKVQENLKAVATVAREAGGYLSQQTDSSIVIRIPAAKFTPLLEEIEKLGDVLHRQVQARDVSEEFRDVQIRLRNAMQVRDRLAELLTRAQKVEESLQIERELERLTGEIERLKGRMQFLQDRIAFSTITVNFQPKEQEQLNNNLFRLPFDWLDALGLQRLLSL